MNRKGNVYVADTYNNRIRKVTVSTDVISTIAGTGTAAYIGNNVAATSAALYYPFGITLDSSGAHFIVILFMSISFLYHDRR